jgi:hypothetical protein
MLAKQFMVQVGASHTDVILRPQNETQLGFFFLKKEDAESLIEKVSSTAVLTAALHAPALSKAAAQHTHTIPHHCSSPIPCAPYPTPSHTIHTHLCTSVHSPV